MKLRVLAIRNDKLGDFMLIWPALMLLKKSLPDCEVTVLVPSYTQSIAEACPWIDNVMIDPLDIASINRKNFDAVVTFFQLGVSACRLGRDGFRYGSHLQQKIAQIFL